MNLVLIIDKEPGAKVDTSEWDTLLNCTVWPSRCSICGPPIRCTRAWPSWLVGSLVQNSQTFPYLPYEHYMYTHDPLPYWFVVQLRAATSDSCFPEW